MSNTVMETANNATLARLEDQIDWYDRKSSSNARWYKRLKLCTMIAAASIPVFGHTGPPAVSSGLGALVLVIEGVQHLNQYQFLWMLYRRTAEALKTEKHLYLAHAGVYAQAADPIPLLAERLETVLSGEQGSWIAEQPPSAKRAATGANQSA